MKLKFYVPNINVIAHEIKDSAYFCLNGFASSNELHLTYKM